MSGVWKTALQFSSPDRGIAVNSWNVSVKINNARDTLCLPLCFPSSLLTLSAASFMHKTVAEELRGEVNQSNVSSRFRQSIPALRVPSFNPSAKTYVQGTVTGACPSKLQIILITSFIMALKKVILCVQRFGVLAVCTALHVAVCLSTQFYEYSARVQKL